MFAEALAQMTPVLTALANSSMAILVMDLCLCIPSALLYAMEVALVLRHRKRDFNSSFFVLFVAKAVANFAGFFGAFLHQRFGQLGLFLPLYLKMPRLCLAFFYFLVPYTFHIENVATALLLLNRLTAIVLPTKYDKLWKHLLLWAILLMFLLPLPFTWFILLIDEYVRVDGPDNTTFSLDNHRNPEDQVDVTIGAYSAVIFTVVCLIINLASLVAYRRQSAIQSASQQQQQQGHGGHQPLSQQAQQQLEMQFKLTVYTLLTFLAQLLYAFYIILLHLSVNESQYWGLGDELWQLLFLAIFNQYPWVNDLCTIVLPAWLLLWASRPMRTRIERIVFRVLPCLKANTNSVGPSLAWSDHHGQS